MDFTDGGISIWDKLEQSSKALFSISIRLEGKSIDFSFSQRLNVSNLIVLRFCGRIIFFKPLQQENASFPIMKTDLGKVSF